ncbi:Amino acid transporter, putative [Hondaea fermentalgiana]|uniref:Amino acid transporter, putative n=1 Tax=Hondaea fermentalgiana TaxID=2315210 RepID=A0A2R5GEI9_9STRA|nr:Amino acid transporter, putative [Hondaea fermentalgiana]|eukprot:GBG27033.1 Amino acid transporter, putative [Hondaea fermentalgiana]
MLGEPKVRDIELNELAVEDRGGARGGERDDDGGFRPVSARSNEGEDGSGGDENGMVGVTHNGPNADALGADQDEGGDDDEVIPGNSGKLGACFNFVNSIVGAGVIGLPFAVAECGFVMGFLLLLVVAYFTHFSVNTLVQLGVLVKERSYEGLCRHCFGKAGFAVVSLFMAIFAFGAMCAYLVIVGDTIPVVLDHLFGVQSDRRLVVFLFALVIILPLSLLRDMAALSWSSSLSITADGIIVLLVIARAAYGVSEWPEADRGPIEPEFTFANSSIFAGFGAISFAYVCQHSSFIVFNTLKVPTTREWDRVNTGAVSTAMIMSVLLSLAGYLAFFNQTLPNILNNFPCNDNVSNVARFLLALTMVFTFPMENFVARHSLFAIYHGFSPTLKGSRRMSSAWHFGLTLGLWGVATIIGVAVTDLGIIIELTGALSASMLGFILPAMCHFKVHSLRITWNKSIKAWDKDHPFYRTTLSGRLAALRDFWVPLFMLVVGIVAMIAGTYTAVRDSFEGGATENCVRTE